MQLNGQCKRCVTVFKNVWSVHIQMYEERLTVTPMVHFANGMDIFVKALSKPGNVVFSVHFHSLMFRSK